MEVKTRIKAYATEREQKAGFKEGKSRDDTSAGSVHARRRDEKKSEEKICRTEARETRRRRDGHGGSAGTEKEGGGK